MKNINMIILFLCFVFVQGNSIGSTVSEHGELMSCSKFHFEERILEKVIRMEHTNELHKKIMEIWEKRMDEKSEQVDEKLNNLVTSFEVKVDEKFKRMDEDEIERRNSFIELKNTIVSDFKSTIDNLTILSENLSSVVTDKQDSAIAAFEDASKKKVAMLEESVERMNVTYQSLITQTIDETKTQRQKVSDVLLELTRNSSLHLKEWTERQNKINKTLFSYVDEFISGGKKVAIKVCAKSKTYPVNSNLEFPHFVFERGVSQNMKTKWENTGVFTCEKSGLYLISVFVMTPTDRRDLEVLLNGKIIAEMYFSVNNDFYQTVSVTVLERLNINDKLTIRTGPNGEVNVYGGAYSCMSILQLT